ncbi:class I SAM-dependent methyltransferase [bacterium]|nr:class I SAM-dependent methyltransferase [bacterium]
MTGRNLIDSAWDGYALLDFGNGRKLERFGHVLLIRPSPQSDQGQLLSDHDWNQADAVFRRGSGWSFNRTIPGIWTVGLAGFRFNIKPVESGSVGLFPEQVENWSWLEQRCRSAGATVSVLNLFAYTGGSSLAAARGGACVCHLDASKGANRWARENAHLNGIAEQKIRWITDDAEKFVEREVRRGHHYDGLVLDPPTFGRAGKGTIWHIQDRLLLLVSKCMSLIRGESCFLLLSCHTPELSTRVLIEMFSDLMTELRGTITGHDLVIHQRDSKRALRCGSCVLWSS